MATTQEKPVAAAASKCIEPGATRPSCYNCYGKKEWDEEECSILCEKLFPLVVAEPVKPVKKHCYTFHGIIRCSECGEEPPPYVPKKAKITPIPYGWGASLGDDPSYQREALIKYLQEKKNQPTQ